MRRAAVLCTALALAGCSVGPDYRRPDLVPPPAYRGAPPAPAASEGYDPAHWWRALHDRELDSLVERALHDSPTLAIALAHLQQARTIEMAYTGAELPRGGAVSGGGRGTGSDLVRGRVPASLGSADHTITGLPHIDRASGLDAVWDIDIFGRVRRQIEAASYDAAVSAAARDEAQVAVIAELVRTYASLRGGQMLRDVEEQNIAVTKSQVDLLQARFDRGLTNEFDVTLAKRQYATLHAQLPGISSRILADEEAIAALLGRYGADLAPELDAPGLLPAVPERVTTGTPIDLLRRRPDVRAAEWQLAGATARVGIAVGNLFPQLALNAGTGVQGEGIGWQPTAQQRIWSVGYTAALPLLDFGLLDAQVKVADLQARIELTRYRAAVQAAVQEVDSSLAEYGAQQQRLRDLDEAVAASRRATELATQRYERGLSDFLNVIDAQRQQYDLAAQYVEAQAAAVTQFAGLARALGGGWEGFEEPSTPRPLPAVMALLGRTTGWTSP